MISEEVDYMELAHLFIQLYLLPDDEKTTAAADLVNPEVQIEDPQLIPLKRRFETDPGLWEKLSLAHLEAARRELELYFAYDENGICQKCGKPWSEHVTARPCYICDVPQGVMFDPNAHGLCGDCKNKIKNIGYCDLVLQLDDGECIFFATRHDSRWPFPFSKYQFNQESAN